jgi:hypothetical protein
MLNDLSSRLSKLLASNPQQLQGVLVRLGGDGETVLVKLDREYKGLRQIPAIAATGCDAGGAVTLLLSDDGQWFAFGKNTRQVVMSRHEVDRGGEEPDPKGLPLKILFSTVADGMRSYYVGGWAAKPELVAKIPTSEYHEVRGFDNMGEEDWIFAIASYPSFAISGTYDRVVIRSISSIAAHNWSFEWADRLPPPIGFRITDQNGGGETAPSGFQLSYCGGGFWAFNMIDRGGYGIRTNYARPDIPSQTMGSLKIVQLLVSCCAYKGQLSPSLAGYREGGFNVDSPLFVGFPPPGETSTVDMPGYVLPNFSVRALGVYQTSPYTGDIFDPNGWPKRFVVSEANNTPLNWVNTACGLSAYSSLGVVKLAPSGQIVTGAGQSIFSPIMSGTVQRRRSWVGTRFYEPENLSYRRPNGKPSKGDAKIKRYQIGDSGDISAIADTKCKFYYPPTAPTPTIHAVAYNPKV